MENYNFECKQCGHKANLSNKEILAHAKNHKEVKMISRGNFSENNLAVKDLLLDGPAYGTEVSN